MDALLVAIAAKDLLQYKQQQQVVPKVPLLVTSIKKLSWSVIHDFRALFLASQSSKIYRFPPSSIVGQEAKGSSDSSFRSMVPVTISGVYCNYLMTTLRV